MSDKKIIISVGVFGVFLVLLLFSFPFWYLASPLYYACESIHKGMTQPDAEFVLSSYQNNGRFEYYRGEFNLSAKMALLGEGIEVDSKFLDMRCRVTFEDHLVAGTEFYFD